MNLYRRLIFIGSVLCFLACAYSADGAVISTLFNTGVGSTGSPLANATIGDPHYSLVSVPGGTTSIRVVTSANGFPVGPWIGDDSVSAWIGPNNDSQADGPIGHYDYRTTFDLTGFAPSTASITGLWATDNEGINILINGVSTGNTIGAAQGFTSFTPFSITGGFVSGINTLDFIVNNDAGPTGLRVEMQGMALTVVPEPATATLLLISAVGLVFGRMVHGGYRNSCPKI